MHLIATRWEDVEWISLALNRNKWCVFVNTAMNSVFHKLQDFFELRTIGFAVGLYCWELENVQGLGFTAEQTLLQPPSL